MVSAKSQLLESRIFRLNERDEYVTYRVGGVPLCVQIA